MNLPLSITQQLQEKFKVDISALQNAHAQAIPISIRINSLKPSCNFKLGNKIPWSSTGYYLPERPVFTNDPLFHAGCYYVQEASSMFVEQAVLQTADTSQPLVVLDACAAPGGKSTLLASLLNDESLLVSNEVISTRVPSLTHNMAKWGTTNSMVTNNDPKDFSRLPDFFDVIMVDAPCSGSGLFRKQENAIEHWSEENMHHCSMRQQRILTDLLPSLKENGILIYSTCSYSEEENETICDYLCDNFFLEPIQLKTHAEWGILETQSEKHKAFSYRFLPHLLQGEGFFLACFRKKSGDESKTKNSIKNLFTKISANEIAAVKNRIFSESIDYSIFQEEIIGFHKNNFQTIQKIISALKVKKMPIHIGQLKGTDFIPHPYLAYQNIMQGFSQINVETSVALQYLRKQPFVLDSDIKGFALLAFQKQNLGWFKNLGNRINNYYPADWRILKDSF